VLVSLFVSFTLDPMLSAIWHDSPSKINKIKPIAWLLGIQDAVMDWLHRTYDTALRWSLKRRKTVLAIAALIFFSSFGLLKFVGTEFVPETDENWANVTIQTPIGSSLNYTMGKAEQVETILREYPEIKRISRNVWKNGAWYGLTLVDKEERKRGKKELDDAIRNRLSNIAGLEVRVGWNRPIQLYVMGPDIKELDRIAKEAVTKIKAIPGTVDVENSYKPTSPTLDITINRELASDLGVSMSSVVTTSRAMIAGEDAGQWEGPDGENHQVLVRLPRSERTTVADLDKIFVPTSGMNADGSPRMVPLRQIAEFTPAFAERQIERRNLQRLVQVWSGVASTHNTGEVSGKVKESLKEISLPPGYQIQFGGQQQEMDESVGYAVAALGLAVIFIYLILASQFGSFLQPIAIMASLPLSLIGVFASLLIFGSTLNLFSVIGFIMLMGLVTKNAILLVDFTNHSRREGMPRDEAILASGQVRLRPILMTTTAMIGGMLPLALAFGAGSEQQSPMAHAVIGGIITSTIMTLVVVPVLYTYFDTWGEKASAWFKRGAKTQSVHVHADVPKHVAGGGSIAPLPAARKDD
jgi:hydrophobic/amphiphilic exporter-1 (mainly G- bacteria), HAE1 family